MSRRTRSSNLAYMIHIERYDPIGKRVPIPENEWVEAVAANGDIRLMAGDVVALNPTTGELISVKNNRLDAELFDEQHNSWMPIFFWSTRGKISFKATAEFENPQSSLKAMATKLAQTLNASVVGDEGEVYT